LEEKNNMAFTKGYALLVGVGEYVDPKLNKGVEITAKDAQSLAGVLTNASMAGYPANQVRVLTKAEATRSSILSALQELKGKTKDDSTVILFLCGHGVADKVTGKYCFLPREATKKADGGYDQNTVINEDELIKEINSIKHQKMLVVFNTCHSGYVAGSLSDDDQELAHLGDAPSNATIDKILNSGQGLYLISACMPDQRSWFIPTDSNTFFIQYLLEGLGGQGGIPNKKGYIGVFELYSHVYDKVSAKISQLGQKQDPVITVQSGVGPFAVSLYQGGVGLSNLGDEGDAGLGEQPVFANQPNPQAIRGINYQIQSGRDTNIAGRDNITGTQNNVSGNQSNTTVTGGQNVQFGNVNAQNFNPNFGTQNNVQGDSINISGNQSSGKQTVVGKVSGDFNQGATYNQQGSTTVNTGGGDYIDGGGGFVNTGDNLSITGGSGVMQFGANSKVETNTYNYGAGGSPSRVEQLFKQLEQIVSSVSDPKAKRKATRALDDLKELRKPNTDVSGWDFAEMREDFDTAGVLYIVAEIMRQPEMSKYLAVAGELTR
jgi:hypothetical protein